MWRNIMKTLKLLHVPFKQLVRKSEPSNFNNKVVDLLTATKRAIAITSLHISLYLLEDRCGPVPDLISTSSIPKITFVLSYLHVRNCR